MKVETYVVEFWDSYAGRSEMHIEAHSADEAATLFARAGMDPSRLLEVYAY